MPWCDPCSQFHASDDLEEGHCPTCGDVVSVESTPDRADGDEATVGQSAPWHFWLVVAALAGYLLWRLIDFIIWVL